MVYQSVTFIILQISGYFKCPDLPIDSPYHFAGEDWKICQCLQRVGCEPVDTRDEEGKERFLVMDVSAHIHGDYPQWYIQRDSSGSLQVTTKALDLTRVLLTNVI